MKKKISNVKVGGLLFSLVALGIFLGCQSGNTSGGDVDQGGEVPSGQSGTLTLSLTDGMSQTTGTMQGFRVEARDSNGSPVPNIRITCDTEDGLALVEPTSGFENTESNGMMSGKVGCENPGSYIMICRLPSPSGIKASETIVCQGQRPAGFVGWPGSGGGGLGGGSSITDTISKVRVTSVTASDNGTSDSSTTSIDITQSICDSGGTPTAEPFFDSSATFTIVNNSTSIVKITAMSYKVANAYGDGRTATSGKLRLTGSASQAIDSNGGTGTVSSLLFDANGGNKDVYGGSALSSGFKNVVFTLYGENELGDKFEIKSATALSFSNFNRCS
jgi:hypothetical protein